MVVSIKLRRTSCFAVRVLFRIMCSPREAGWNLPRASPGVHQSPSIPTAGSVSSGLTCQHFLLTASSVYEREDGIATRTPGRAGSYRLHQDAGRFAGEMVALQAGPKNTLLFC